MTEEKTSRSVLCEAHGLRYDPQTQDGCVRCRREQGQGGPGQETEPTGAAASTSSGGPPLILFVLGAAVLGVGIWMFWDSGEAGSDSAATPDSASASAADSTADRPSGARRPSGSAAAAASGDGDSTTADGFRLVPGNGRVSISDRPEEELFFVSGKPAPDIRQVRFNADGETLDVVVEFEQNLATHASEFAVGITPVALYLDLDNDAESGGRGFAGRVGFEASIEGKIGVRYDGDAESYFWGGGAEATPIYDFSCSHSLQPILGGDKITFYDESEDRAKDNTSCSGAVMNLSVPYSVLDVKPGQTIRIATEENMGSGKLPQYFLDDALLTLP